MQEVQMVAPKLATSRLPLAMHRRGADCHVLARKRGNAREVIAIGSGQPAMGGRLVVRRIAKYGSVEPNSLSSLIVGSLIRPLKMDDAMLDNPEKTTRLLAALKAAAPFDVELAPSLIEYLQAQNVADADRMHHVVWDLSYAGDEGGIICHLSRSEETGRALVVSLTHVRVPRSMPLAAAVLDYQKHRVKKLKKQGRR
jgi:hypothetical protein